MSRRAAPGGATDIAWHLWEELGRRKALAVRDALSARLRKERLSRRYPQGALISIKAGTARVVMRGERLLPPPVNGNGNAALPGGAVTTHQ